jgi:hypothetical protein
MEHGSGEPRAIGEDRGDHADTTFSTETAGLPEVGSPSLVRLSDGDRLDLRIGAVRKRLDDAELRMLA